MITVLVTGVGGGVGEGILKCFRRIDDLQLRVITGDMSPLAAGLYSGDVAVLTPPFDSPDYAERIIDLCRQESVDFFFPGTDLELMVCAENAEYIQREAGTKVVISPPSAVRIANDKYATCQFLKENDLPYPETYLPHEVVPESLKYPVIVKPRIGWHSTGIELLNDPAALRACLADRNDVVIQEQAGGEDDEFTCTVVNVDGKLSEPVILRRVLRSGDTYRATPVNIPEIADYVCHISEKLGVYGSSNFQLRTDQGVPKLFEINCRFSGTTPFCAELGMNPVEFYLKTQLGLPYKSKLRFDVTVFRAWSEVVVENSHIEYLRKNGRVIPGVIDRGNI